MNTDPITPSHGAAQVLVLKNVVGMMFWICGLPGSESMVNVNAPSAMVPGIKRFGMPPWRNISAANGYTANTTTNSDTPPYVSTAHTSTMESIARSRPTSLITDDTIDFENPDSSLTLPKLSPTINHA